MQKLWKVDKKRIKKRKIAKKMRKKLTKIEESWHKKSKTWSKQPKTATDWQNLKKNARMRNSCSIFSVFCLDIDFDLSTFSIYLPLDQHPSIVIWAIHRSNRTNECATSNAPLFEPMSIINASVNMNDKKLFNKQTDMKWSEWKQILLPFITIW